MVKQRKKRYEIEIEIKFIPFPDEERRKESYRKWVRAFLSSKLKQDLSDNPTIKPA